jgi:hypothetical protein
MISKKLIEIKNQRWKKNKALFIPMDSALWRGLS